MRYIFTPPPTVSLPIQGREARFPVRRIYCVGRNYAEHAREMGHDPNASPPFFFAKPADALVESGSSIPYPPLTQDLHHEVELVVALSDGGANIAVEAAEAKIFGYGVGVDLTRRNLQGAAKKAGKPWEAGKAFERSAPCGSLAAAEDIGHPAEGRIALSVNGELRQEGDLNQMIWPVPHIISKLSQLFELAPGDLILTGTPAGVAPRQPGARVAAEGEGVGELTFEIQSLLPSSA